MCSRTSHIVAALVLVICLTCPVLEMFDQWDHTAQTGNDTEYAFVIIGLCVGTLYIFAQVVFGFPLLKSAIEHVFGLRVLSSPQWDGQVCFYVVPIPLAPHVLALRL
jgi:hypothetical protein